MTRRSGAMFAALSIAALIASAALAQDVRPCAARAFAPQLMTPAAGTLPRDGALVVGLFPGGSDASGILPAMSLVRGRRITGLTSQQIAPGLYRMMPIGARLAGRYDLTGVAAAPELYFRRATLAAPPVAPALERAERYLVASARGERLEVRAHFSFPMAAGVVAVVGYWGDDAEADVFARGAPTQSSVVVFTSESGCPAHPAGTRPPPESGGTLSVAFVDLHGQLSQRSEARPIE